MIFSRIKLLCVPAAALLVYLLSTCTDNRNPLARDDKYDPDGSTYREIALDKTALTAACELGFTAVPAFFSLWNTKTTDLNYTITDDVTWLSCSPASGSSTGEHDTITVTYSTAGLAESTYTASIVISCDEASNSPETVAVTLTVSDDPLISISKTALSPACTLGTDAIAGGFEVWNSGNSVLNYTITDDATWLSCSPASGSSNGEHDAITVTYSMAGLAEGSHTATITVASAEAANSPRTIAVTLTVATDPVIGLSTASLNPACSLGTNAAAGAFEIWNSGNGTLDYTISDDAAWLSCSPASGNSNGEHDAITVTYSTAGLAEGSHTATITVASAEAVNSPRTIVVTLTVFTDPVVIGLSTASLSPACSLGTNAAAGAFEIWNSGNGTLDYTISDDAAWLSCSPSSGNSTGEHDAVTVTYTTSGVTSGTHTAAITINGTGATNTPQTVSVTLTILGSPAWQPGDSLVDIRDGQKYATVVIGTQCWMAENLNVGIYKASVINGSYHSDVSNNSIIEKYAYNNDTTNFATYGGLYDWNEAMGYSATEGVRGICPNGWHIPTDGEWKTLEMYLGMSSSDANNSGWRGTDQGTQLKVGGSSGFQVLLSGYRSIDGAFLSMGSYAYFWSSSWRDISGAWYRRLYSGYTDVYRHGISQMNGCCVRCVKD